MTQPTPSLRGRILLAVALTVAFYTLALVIAAGLIAGPIVLWTSSGHGNLWLTVACVGAGVAILRSIVPERARFEPPGPELTPDDQPALHAEIDSVARAIGARVPDAVYLDLPVNAAVLEHRRRRIMLLGLPLFATLGRDELRAVIAHEYGHYLGGDTRFSNWIWRTRTAVLKTVQSLASSSSAFRRRVVRAPFDLYARLFLRITNAVSRRAEFAADAVSVRASSAEAAGRALRRVSALDPAFASYWQNDVTVMLEAEIRPPIAVGFGSLAEHRDLAAALDQVVASDLEAAEPDPYASHPTLRQRLEALGVATDAQVPPPPTEPAAALLHDLPDLERRLLDRQLGEDVGRLPAGSWEQAGSVHLERLRNAAARFGSALPRGATVEQAGALVLARDEWRSSLRELLEPEDREVPEEAIDGFAFSLLCACVTVAAVETGAAVTAAPGEKVLVRRGDVALDPWTELGRVAQGEEPPETWELVMRAAGLAGVALLSATSSGADLDA